MHRLLYVFVIFILFWLWVKRHFSYWQRRRIFHVKPNIPHGNMYDWTRSVHSSQIFSGIYLKFKRSGPYAGFFFNTQKALIVLDVDLANRILEQDFDHFEHRGFFHNEKNDPLTGNLMLLDGDKWKSLRTKMNPLFVVQKIKDMFPSVLEVGEELQQVFEEKVRESHNGVIDVTYLASRYMTDVISLCAYGTECYSLRDPSISFSVMARTFFSQCRHYKCIDSLINCFPGCAKFLGMKIIPENVSDFFMGMIKVTVREREEENIRLADFLGLLMKLKSSPGTSGKENLTIKELAAQAFSFFVAAFDTSSATISYTLFELALNPHIQTRLRAEIIQTMKTCRHKLSFHYLKNMKYLDKVISETLRLHPVTPALFRKCTKTYIPSNNSHYKIEKGCAVVIPTLNFHLDPDYFPEPLKFDPERFSTANASNIKAGSYLPFGSGMRNCIGKEFGLMLVKIGIIKFIQHYKFEICHQTKLPVEIALRSVNLIPLDITLKVTRA